MPREYITREIQLYGESESGRFTRTFRIMNVISGEGASSVSYEAYHEGSSIGVLKEFYPEDIFSLVRQNDNQLVCSDMYRNDIETFRQEKMQ